jgi:ornithine decarboxylase
MAGGRVRVREWLLRYGPAEVAGTAGAILAATAVDRFAVDAATAYAGAIGEGFAFYAVLLIRDLRRQRATRGHHGAVRRTVRDLVVEFGPAEALDTLLVRPLAMYLGTVVLGTTWLGVAAGKVAADAVFYALAIAAYETRKSLAQRRATGPDPAAPADLAEQAKRAPWDLATPYLLMDLDRVERAYLTLADGLGVDAIHYAVKCNPDRRVLATLHRVGCRFEVASYAELALLADLGVDPPEVLYSNPVKPVDHIRRAWAAGLWRFAVDGEPELSKLADHAPGAAVYVRLRTRPRRRSGVPSEGKFGVDPDSAADLLLAARGLGLRPYGLAFHTGSQMTDAAAWADAIDELAPVLTRLAAAGIRIDMLDIGGGFPARYAEEPPVPHAYGRLIRRALDRLPYRPHVVAEPGRALVAEAGTLVASVIGTAVRAGRRWVHLDVGAFNGVMEALETGNTLRYPVADSRQAARRVRCHLTGPTCDGQDTLLFDVGLSEGLTAGDHVYIGTAGAYTTAYASRFNGFDIPRTWCVSSGADLDHGVRNAQMR